MPQSVHPWHKAATYGSLTAGLNMRRELTHLERLCLGCHTGSDTIGSFRPRGIGLCPTGRLGCSSHERVKEM